ncbi:MAG: hypothetical protein ACYSUB_13560 [Planctomycetota bacterium]|jgi:hypothetical protein
MRIVGQKDIKPDSAFVEEIAKRSGENVATSAGNAPPAAQAECLWTAPRPS